MRKLKVGSYIPTRGWADGPGYFLTRAEHQYVMAVLRAAGDNEHFTDCGEASELWKTVDALYTHLEQRK
jgi:hypothetical protein